MEKLNALIIDKNKASRKNLLSVIKNGIGIKDPRICESSAQAITLLKQNKAIDLIFVDYETVTDGFETFIISCKELLADQDAKYILLASNASKSFLVKAASLGISTFILKPFIYNTVVNKVKKISASKQQRNAKRLTLFEPLSIELIHNNQEIPAAILDISSGGCLTEAKPLGKHGLDIFSKLSIKIPFNDEHVMVTSQLIRMERSDNENISAAFIFEGMGQDVAMQFAKLWAYLLGSKTK